MWGTVTEYQKIYIKSPSAWSKDQKADCGVVLTGESYSRIQEGFSLLYLGGIKKLIISGVYPASQLKDIYPLWPFFGSLNPNDIILEKRSTTTYGNALQSLQLVEALNCKDIILVTSTTHMYRASKTFHEVFPDNISIYERSVIAGAYKAPLYVWALESFKSLFYSLWTYE